MKNNKITIYSNGLVHCSACVPSRMTKKEVETEVNAVNFTGIDSKWKVSKDKFKTGESNPTQCEDDKDRKHYLMVC